jgi:adenylate kinase-like protein
MAFRAPPHRRSGSSASIAERGHRLERVIELRVDEDELVNRLSARRVLVRGEWVKRDDDGPGTVRHRLAVYRRQTAPLTEFYAALGLLTAVDASGEVQQVTARVLAALGVDVCSPRRRRPSGPVGVSSMRHIDHGHASV